MRYLLDTDWVVHCLHGVARVIGRLDQLMPEGVGLSIVSMAELYQGVFFSTDPDGNERALREFLFGIAIMPLDDEVCRIFAQEWGRLRASGTPIGDFDLLIGATAMRHDLTLLTNNRRHFEGNYILVSIPGAENQGGQMRLRMTPADRQRRAERQEPRRIERAEQKWN